MKKILVLLFFGVVAVSGCIKHKVDPLDNTDTPYLKFSLVTPTSSFPLVPLIPDASVSEQYLSFVDEGIKAKLEGPITAPSDITVKYEIDAAGLSKLNADALAKDPTYKPFFRLPDSTFTILVKQDVIKKGSVYAEKETDNIVIYPEKIDPSINYILPLKLSSSSYASSKGTSTIFYYIIGNPIAGAYNWDFSRWNSPDTTGCNCFSTSLSFTGDVALFLPTDPTTVEVASGYYTGQNYIITFDNNNGVLSNFKVKPSQAMLTDFSNGGITITSGPTLLVADPVAKHFKVQLVTASRFLIDDYYR